MDRCDDVAETLSIEVVGGPVTLIGLHPRLDRMVGIRLWKAVASHDGQYTILDLLFCSC